MMDQRPNARSELETRMETCQYGQCPDAGISNGFFYIIIKVNETKSKRDKWSHGSSVEHTKQQRKESVYRMRELFAHCPPNEGFIAIIHSIFIVCREFKKQDSDYTMSSCFEQSQAHEAQ